MSTAAHEPRRAGPRRADSPSGSKVTPRRNAPETSEHHGAQYDSEELPVLIRLPNLRDLGPVETRTPSPSQKNTHRIDPPSARKHRTSKHQASNGSKKSLRQQASDNKLVIGGIIGGILVGVMLFVLNANGPTPPKDEDGWADQEPQLFVKNPEVPPSAAIDPPPLPAPPALSYTAPSAEETQFASGELEKAPLDAPYYDKPLVPREAEALSPQSTQLPVEAWPSEETMGPPTTGGTPTDLWPGESVSVEPNGSQYPLTDSPSQNDYQSSMYPSDANTYRMGKLDTDRPQTVPGDRSSILDGKIEIPDTKSVR